VSLAIGLLGKKWRVRAAFNEKILVRIAYHAFCLQEVESWVFYLLVVFGRTIKIFDMLLKYEIMRFFGLCLSRLKFSEPKLGLSRQNAKYHLKWRSHPLIHTFLKINLAQDVEQKKAEPKLRTFFEK